MFYCFITISAHNTTALSGLDDGRPRHVYGILWSLIKQQIIRPHCMHRTDVVYCYTWRGVGWRRGVVVSGVRRMNEFNARRARLVPGWVTVFGRVYYLGM